MAATSITDLVPYREDSQADSGKLSNWPTGSAKSTSPRPASLSPNAVFMSGIRLAHVEKVSPARKKKAPTATLYILGCIVIVVFIIFFFVHKPIFQSDSSD